MDVVYLCELGCLYNKDVNIHHKKYAFDLKWFKKIISELFRNKFTLKAIRRTKYSIIYIYKYGKVFSINGLRCKVSAQVER